MSVLKGFDCDGQIYYALLSKIKTRRWYAFSVMLNVSLILLVFFLYIVHAHTTSLRPLYPAFLVI